MAFPDDDDPPTRVQDVDALFDADAEPTPVDSRETIANRNLELAAMRDAVVPLEERVAKLEKDHLEMGIEIQNLIAMMRVIAFKEP